MQSEPNCSSVSGSRIPVEGLFGLFIVSKMELELHVRLRLCKELELNESWSFGVGREGGTGRQSGEGTKPPPSVDNTERSFCFPMRAAW